MSIAQAALLISAIQLAFGVLTYFGVFPKVFGRKKRTGLGDITLEAKRGMTRNKVVLILLFGGLAFAAFGFYRTFDQPKITEENVEPKIRQWLDAFGIGSKKLAEPSLYFAYQADLVNGVPLAISRSKEHSHYITVSGRIEVSQVHRDLYDKLSEIEKLQFFRALRLDSAKARITCAVQEEPFKIIGINKLIPITDNLSEATLIDTVREMNFAMLVIRDSIALRLEASGKAP